MSWFQRLSVAIQLAAALAADLTRLASRVGAEALVPPTSTPGVRVRLEGQEFELRLHVRRIA